MPKTAGGLPNTLREPMPEIAGPLPNSARQGPFSYARPTRGGFDAYVEITYELDQPVEHGLYSYLISSIESGDTEAKVADEGGVVPEA